MLGYYWVCLTGIRNLLETSMGDKQYQLLMILLLVAGVALLVLSFVIKPAQAASDPLVDLYGTVVAQQAAQDTVDRLKDNPRVYLQWLGIKQGLSQWEIDRLSAIITCESTWNPGASNGQYKGLFQMGRNEFATYGTGDPLNPHDNIRAGIKLYQQRSFQPWSCNNLI